MIPTQCFPEKQCVITVLVEQDHDIRSGNTLGWKQV